MALARMRHLVAKMANRFGLRIERALIGDQEQLDAFDLIIRYLNLVRGDCFFFIQVGANDGITVDPIRKYVVENHWNGILIEPQPRIFEKLRENYRNEPQLTFENLAIADQDGILKLYYLDESIGIPAASGWASFDKKNVKRLLGRNAPVKEMEVPAVTISTLLAKHGVKSVDLLQIDTEGYDIRIIKSLLKTEIEPLLIRFEWPLFARQELQNCLSLLANRGYRMHRDRVDIIAYKGLAPGLS